jgi:hypothetical protein
MRWPRNSGPPMRSWARRWRSQRSGRSPGPRWRAGAARPRPRRARPGDARQRVSVSLRPSSWARLGGSFSNSVAAVWIAPASIRTRSAERSSPIFWYWRDHDLRLRCHTPGSRAREGVMLAMAMAMATACGSSSSWPIRGPRSARWRSCGQVCGTRS